MLNRNGFFVNKAAKYMSISYEGFLNAAKNGDSDVIDIMLEAKNNGSKLNLNGEDSSENALEILLKRKDFVNARKLIKAGADTGVTSKTWVDDDGPYPYGGYETTRRDFFQEFAHDREIINFLKKEAPNKLQEYKHGSSYQEAKESYENAKRNLEACEKAIMLFESDSNDHEEDSKPTSRHG